MNVLSLFDGMSCGQIALNQLGFKVDNYFASEIDKHAMKVCLENYPSTIQLGDIRNLSYKDNKLFKGNEIVFEGNIDLLIGGSPCQGFSFEGKGLNFEDPRSSLFFEYVRLLKEIKPKNFLLENVKMKKEYQDVVSECLGVQPININSNCFSAQNRNRLYWTNIKIDDIPLKNNFVFKDIRILEDDFEYWKDFQMTKFENKEYVRKDSYKVIQNDEKVFCLMSQFGHNKPKTFEGSKLRYLTPIEWERLQTVPDNYTKGASTNQRYKMLGNGWTIKVIEHIFKNIKNECIKFI